MENEVGVIERDEIRMEMARMRAERTLKDSWKARKERKPPGPRVSKRRFILALAGTGGIKKLIAERLNVTVGTVSALLKRKGWEDVQEFYQDEVDRIGDLAEETIRAAIEQRLDMNVAARTAQWLLTRPRYKNRGFMDEKQVKIEGGEGMVQIQQNIVSIASLQLPLGIRRQILEAIESSSNDNELKEEAKRLGCQDDVEGETNGE